MENNLYILIGCTIDPEDQGYQANTYFKSDVSVSNSEYERKLFSGFKLVESDFLFLSAPVCGTWPFSAKKRIVDGFTNTKNLNTVRYNCSFGIRNYSKQKALYKNLKKIVKENQTNKRIHIIACELHKPYLICLKKIKKKYKNIFTTTIILDLPKFVNNDSKIRQFVKNIENKSVLSLARKYSDSYVCLTHSLANLVSKSNKPVLVSEGIIEIKRSHSKENRTNEIVRCLYVGKVDKANGMDIIIETAQKMNNIQFDICGTGDFDASRFIGIQNIVYHGFVTQKEVETLIEESNIVLSPRIPTNEEYLSYSFPSKIFSYLGHLKPIISYWIPCYKNTIFEKAFVFPKDLTSDAMVDAIESIIENNFNIPSDVYEKILQMYSAEKLAKDIMGLLK